MNFNNMRWHDYLVLGVFFIVTGLLVWFCAYNINAQNLFSHEGSGHAILGIISFPFAVASVYAWVEIIKKILKAKK